MPQQKTSLDRIATITLAAVIILLGTMHTASPVPSFDSTRYANVGHWIAEGRGVSSSVSVVPVQEGTADRGDGLRAFTIQPPALSWFYAVTGVDNRQGAHRLLNLIAFVVLAGSTWLLAPRLVGTREGTALAALLTASTPVVLQSAASMWTDLPFAALMTTAIFFLVRSHDESRPLVWLAGSAALAGVAVTFRYPGLGLGLMFVVDAGLAWRRAGLRRALLRLTLSLGIFAVIAVPLLVRNMMLAGSWTGTAPRAFALAPGFDLLRGWSFVGSRLMQVFVPGFGSAAANEFMVMANRTPAGWWGPKVFGPALVIAGAVWMFLRRRSGHGFRVSDGVVTLLAAGVGYLIVVWGGAARHLEIHVIEFRYALPLAPLLFIGLAALVSRSLPARIGSAVALVLGIAFLLGAFVQPRPQAADHGFLSEGLAWLEANVPAEDAILTNGGKVLLDEDIARRVHHLSVWHYKHALPEIYRTEVGMNEFLAERDIRWIVLIGRPDRRMPLFFGDLIVGLFTCSLWQDRLVHRSEGMLVYRIPATMPMYGGSR
jgi:hypothetical protein